MIAFQISGTMASNNDFYSAYASSTCIRDYEYELSPGLVTGIIRACLGLPRIQLRSAYDFEVESKIINCEGFLIDYKTTSYITPHYLKNMNIEKSMELANSTYAEQIRIFNDIRIRTKNKGAFYKNSRNFFLLNIYAIAIIKKIPEKHSESEIFNSLKYPIFTPYIGKKCCPLNLPMNPKICSSILEYE